MSHGSPSGRGAPRRGSRPSYRTVTAINSGPHQNSALPSAASSALATTRWTDGMALRRRELALEPVAEAGFGEARAGAGEQVALAGADAEVERLRVGDDLARVAAPGQRAADQL